MQGPVRQHMHQVWHCVAGMVSQHCCYQPVQKSGRLETMASCYLRERQILDFGQSSWDWSSHSYAAGPCIQKLKVQWVWQVWLSKGCGCGRSSCTPSIPTAPTPNKYIPTLQVYELQSLSAYHYRHWEDRKNRHEISSESSFTVNLIVIQLIISIPPSVFWLISNLIDSGWSWKYVWKTFCLLFCFVQREIINSLPAELNSVAT